MSASGLPNSYAAERNWYAPNGIDFDRYGALAENWEHSKKTIKEIRECLGHGLSDEILTLAVAGSLGRMEAADGVSDCDLIVVLTDPASQNETRANELYSAVWNKLGVLGIRRPKRMGTFSQPTSTRQLCHKANIGAPDEDMRSFAKRLLFLLETQPVYNDTGYKDVIKSVIECYAERFVAKDPKKEWGFLINDLVRYFRSLCVNYRWDFENEPEKWLLRNIKLRHSRLVMYGGLLMLLGECSRERENKVAWLTERLLLTPLERIALVYSENKDTNFFRLAGFYDTFLGMLSQKEVRQEFEKSTLGKIDPDQKEKGFTSHLEIAYEDRYKSRNYAILKANSDGLVAELIRFILGRRGVWSERFFEYLIF